jgi:hypothetical protein
LFKKKTPNISQHSLSGHDKAGTNEYKEGIILDLLGKELTDKYTSGTMPLIKYVTWNRLEKEILSVPKRSQNVTNPPQKVW